MSYILLEWTEFLVRWLHVIAGIAWIGSSFYFIALDLSLIKRKDIPKNAHGEAWQVHGGGFYNLVKYLVAPDHLPDHLTWFKWEAYATWISGAALFVLIYYLGAELYLIDYEKMELTPPVAIFISISGIIVGWVAYDIACKSPLGKNRGKFLSTFFFQCTVLVFHQMVLVGLSNLTFNFNFLVMPA